MTAKTDISARQSRSESGFPAAPLPVAIGKMAEIAIEAFDSDAWEQTVDMMLRQLASLEPTGRAGLRLTQNEEQLSQHSVMAFASHLEEASIEDGQRMFPQAAQEHIVALPAGRGSLHVAASKFESHSPQSLDLQLPRAGALLLLAADRASQRRLNQHLQRQLWQSQKLATVGQSAASVVHELNNPLTTIMTYSDFLLKRFDADDTMRDRLHRIHEAGQRIHLFSKQLLDYSRPSTSLAAPVDIHAVMDRALSFCMHLLRSSDVAIERSYRDVPMLKGLETPLTQVFVNLITNAKSAMGDKSGTIRLATRSTESHVTIEVSDEGSGIAAEHLPHLFDAYFTTKNKAKGVGLGLHIVKQIISEHGGDIRATNRPTGGALFIIELPTTH